MSDMLEIYDGRNYVGFVIGHKGGYSARDAAGERVGTYGNRESAIEALMANWRTASKVEAS